MYSIFHSSNRCVKHSNNLLILLIYKLILVNKNRTYSTNKTVEICMQRCKYIFI